MLHPHHTHTAEMTSAIRLVVIATIVALSGCAFNPYVPAELEGTPIAELVVVENVFHKLEAVDGAEIPHWGGWSAHKAPDQIYVSPGEHEYRFDLTYKAGYVNQGISWNYRAPQMIPDYKSRVFKVRVRAEPGQTVNFSWGYPKGRDYGDLEFNYSVRATSPSLMAPKKTP